MSNMEFYHPERGVLLFGIVVLAFFVFRSFKLRKIYAEHLKTSKTLDPYTLQVPKNRRFKEFLFMLACLFAVAAFMRPQWGAKEHVRKVQGVDLCVALDLSNSMRAEDVTPNRLGYAKRQLLLFLEKMHDMRISVVGFAGGAFIAVPVTSDMDAAGDLLSPLDQSFVSRPSTYIQGALLTCAEALGYENITERDDSDKDRDSAGAVLLVTDGEDSLNVDSDVVQGFAKKKIPIYTFLVGGTKPVPMPLRDDNNNVDSFVKDPKTGETAETTVEDKIVKDLAQKTGAKVYFSQQVADFPAIFSDELSHFQTKAREEGIEVEKEEQFQWPLLAAVLILILELFVTERGTFLLSLKRKYFKSLVLLLAFGAASSLHAAEPLESIINNYALSLVNRGRFVDAEKWLQKNLESSPDNRNIIFNWTAVRLQKINQKLQGAAAQGRDPKDDPAIQELQAESEDLAKILEGLAKSESDEARKKEWFHQLAQAEEFAGKLDPAIDAYYDSLGDPPWPQLDAASKHNLARLLKKKTDGDGGGGGGGQGGKGGGQGQDKKGDQAKKPQDYKGQNFTKEQVKQIMQNVTATERNVIQKKSRGEAQKRAREWGAGAQTNPW